MKIQIAFAVAALLLAGCASVGHDSTNWEYKVVSGQVLSGEIMLEKEINRAAAQGWEVVSASQATDQWGFVVMRRERR